MSNKNDIDEVRSFEFRDESAVSVGTSTLQDSTIRDEVKTMTGETNQRFSRHSQKKEKDESI